MKDVIIFLSIFVTIYVIYLINIAAFTSSPVEEMYHKQLVTVIDSILNARHYGEVIDSDDVSVPHDQFGRIIWPSNH